ncbi:MAG: phosphatidylinositol mannoside acyltransferase [Acidimicrobiia bacterium]|nr:phosphatidylinositol mannoside acyltransferase [Acidimicrobiia bacterium]MCY4432681.1 phosphatidylinositol mannoside acyltransferase [bacterium]
MTDTAEQATPIAQTRRPSADVILYRSGAALARRLPQSVGAALTRAISKSAYRLLPERRFITERRLQRVCGPDLEGEALAEAVKASFESYARYWFDCARLYNLDDAAVDAGFSTEGFHHIDEAMATGTAPILALPHLGGWEWAGTWMARIPGYRVISVVEPLRTTRLFDWMVEERRRMGIDIVPLGPDSVSALIKSLRAGQVVCLLSDRQVGRGGVEVEFFGERTLLPGGPAALALRTGAAILPAAVYQDGPNHRGVVMPPVSAERQGRLRADVARITQDLAWALEGLIRAAPEQWHLMQPNWASDTEALSQFRQQRKGAGRQPNQAERSSQQKVPG